MSKSSLPRASDLRPAQPDTACCAGCRQRFPRRELVTVHEGRHDGLHFFGRFPTIEE